ncbi:hypothetical protein EXIGLDRAFT_630029 [Exidia glandulosa HHB12029]|uniref:DUF659 domain-containing protein n=1 Tax=Exidia glandulosa HHB12029 TaxID=1314781 RepID=A0A165BFA2_EXIGL|nr:hypothetical protein EXIGLDRAFT_630029 [Exidia glandulosa HHB12029]
MAGPLLRAQVKRSIVNVRRKDSGKLAMAQWDGWKNKVRRPVITGMMTVEGEAYLVRSHDTFGKPKTAAALWGTAQGDMEYMQKELDVDVIGACTDDGPDGKGMRNLARIELPWLILLLCWAHQNQLIIGDLIRQNPALKRLLGRALDLIKWFLNHGTALALLHKEQLLDSEVRAAVTLLLPVITRWGAHYVSISRLLRLKDAVRTVCVCKADELLAIRTRADANESKSSRTMTAQEVITLVADHTFWTDLKRAKEHIEPLAISCHILQADGVRMDQVLLTLANLFRIYAASHELFILSVLFNPYIRNTCFRDTVLPPNVIAEICIRQYLRIMRHEPNSQFWAACNRYMNSMQLFAPARMALERHRITAEQEVTQLNLVQIWEAIRCEDALTLNSCRASRPPARYLAIRILSAVANSGACERCFSRFGITHTALRNRLAVQSTHDINMVRMDVDAAHATAGVMPSRLKRQLGRTSSSAGPPGRAGALQDAVMQLLADEDTSGDVTDLDRLADHLATGDSSATTAPRRTRWTRFRPRWLDTSQKSS